MVAWVMRGLAEKWLLENAKDRTGIDWWPYDDIGRGSGWQLPSCMFDRLKLGQSWNGGRRYGGDSLDFHQGNIDRWQDAIQAVSAAIEAGEIEV